MDTSEDESEQEEVATLSSSIEKLPNLLVGDNGRHTVEALPGQGEVVHEPRLISSADLDGCEGSTARLEDVDFDDLAG